MAITIDKEKVKQKIARLRDKIHTEANPQLLNEYRLLFKQEISFFRRSWAAAYLLMLYDQEQGQDLSGSRGDRGAAWPPRSKAKVPARGEAPKGTADQGRERRNQGNGPADTAAYAADRPALPEEESRRLFISIGRNRHLFPREILGLITTKAQVAREDIGAIRILDSYSFVQVRDSAADAIIQALNGAMFRGRTLAVNYARSKREEDSPETAAEDTAAEDTAAEDTAAEGSAAETSAAEDTAAEDTDSGDTVPAAADTVTGDDTVAAADDGPEIQDGAEDPPEDRAAPEDSPDSEFPLEQGDDQHDKDGV